MLTSRSQNVIRTLALTAAAAIIVGMPVAAGAETSAPAAKPSLVATRKHARAAAAQEQGQQNERLQQMAQRLKLTDDQVAKVRAIMASQELQGRELRAKFKGQPATTESKEALENAHKELRADTEAKLAQVLSPEQMSEFQKMRGEHMRKEGAKEEKEEAKEAQK